jgi:hypothetical protein
LKQTDIDDQHHFYFPRRLHYQCDDGQSSQIEDVALLTLAGPRILLGEPGMGKTELIQQLGRTIDVEPITAVRFMHSKNPLVFLQPDKPLLIDALDEAMARKEGDAIDAILAQLEAMDCPNFILSCRAREWQSRTQSNLKILYGREPIICTLEPLSRVEAKSFLESRYPTVDCDAVLGHLDSKNLADLYGNPLTLGLMGRVAANSEQLPQTRAGLFERVSCILWAEHDPDRHDMPLGQLTESEALNSAGAMCAALLFSGRETFTIAGASHATSDDIRISEIKCLPDAENAPSIFASKLFKSAGTGRALPFHKVVAEFLAARWLGHRANSPRLQRRLLAQLNGSGSVPASLRGLHAWLAFHSAAMAEQVISADPYGVVRYGEADNLTPRQAECMFNALGRLPETDPYFRANDWETHPIAGLMIPSLRDKIDGIIASPNSNNHLRSLFIEGVQGTPLATELAPTLENIMRSRERFYSERSDSAMALMPLRDVSWCLTTIEQLRCMGDEDSTRLAMNLIRKTGVENVSDQIIVETVFAEMGLTLCAVPKMSDRRSSTMRYYGHIPDQISRARIPSLLDLITLFASAFMRQYEWQHDNELADLISKMLLRLLDDNALTGADAPRMWRWLSQIEQANRYRREAKKELARHLTQKVALRRAIQDYAIGHARTDQTIWVLEGKLSHRMVGIGRHLSDIAYHLSQLADSDNQDERIRDDWKDFLQLARRPDGLAPEVKTQAVRFVRNDSELETFLHNIEHPEMPEWERKQQIRSENEARVREAKFATYRQSFTDNRESLRAGEIGYIFNPAKCYLGLLYEIDSEQPPIDRVKEWLGSELCDDVLVGLEAVLHRTDLPTSEDIAASAVKETTYKFTYPIIAAFLHRHHKGIGIADLSDEICWIGLLLFQPDRVWGNGNEAQSIRELLEKRVFCEPRFRERFARMQIQPYLSARHNHAPGLYKLKNEPEWHEVGGALAAEWLQTYPNLPENVELELIDCLISAGKHDLLRGIAQQRNKGVFRSFEHMLAWAAVDVAVRFDDVASELQDIGQHNPEFIWYLRNRILPEHRGRMLPLSISQREWIISQFRQQWPYATLNGQGTGDTNPYDATNFLRSLINALADDVTSGASDAMRHLSNQPRDSYTDLIQHMAAQQNQKRAETAFEPLSAQALAALLSDEQPANIDDLKHLVLEEIAVAQAKLRGEDIDQLRDFWTDAGIPRDENRCRDRLAAIIGPELNRYDVQRITEADMPNNKRVDLAFSRGEMQLPTEIKGQWHDEVWDAASHQLDELYLIDWRSQQRGIYCVLWFGEQPSKTGRRLKPHPDGLASPATPDQMRAIIVERIPESRRPMIDVVVLDLSVSSAVNLQSSGGVSPIVAA